MPDVDVKVYFVEEETGREKVKIVSVRHGTHKTRRSVLRAAVDIVGSWRGVTNVRAVAVLNDGAWEDAS